MAYPVLRKAHRPFGSQDRPFVSQDKQECLCHLTRIAIRICDEKGGGEGLNAGGSSTRPYCRGLVGAG